MAPVPIVESEVPVENQAENAPESAPSKPTIGIIYPPPELRSILFKFCTKILENSV